MFKNVSALNAAVRVAYGAAHDECRRMPETRNGFLRSRGRNVYALTATGNLPICEGEQMPWDGSKKMFVELVALFANNDDVIEVGIEGGLDWAASLQDFADHIYDPWVNEWAVVMWKRGDAFAAPVAKHCEGLPATITSNKSIADKIEHYDDERSIGNPIIVTLRDGWCFDDIGSHVFAEDTVHAIVHSIRDRVRPCNCERCNPTTDA